MKDSEDEGARSEPEGRAAAFSLTRSRQPCLRKSRKLKQEKEPEGFY